MPIKVLDKQTIDHIAAGEVVEKPASVVKELVENSIDAGATAITVEVKDGGISFIRVTDNGCGIAKDELRTAFLRHATSKITDKEDLNAITTLGFRGEALSSICAVSRLEVISREPQELTGTRLSLEGGFEIDFNEIGAPTGTTILVRDLFFNTPARKKFLKTPITETSYISDFMQFLAISKPEIAFQYTVNGQSRFHTTGNGDLKETIYRVFGREISEGLLPFEANTEGIQISGFLGKPEMVRANRNFEVYYINHRYVKSGYIAKAIEEGYKEYLMQHKFPVVFLNFQVDPHVVDVNVHPTKMEVRISGQATLAGFLATTIQKSLKSKEMLPSNSLMTSKEHRDYSKASLREVQVGKNPEPFLYKKESDTHKKDNIPVVQERSIYSISYKPTDKKIENEDFIFEDHRKPMPISEESSPEENLTKEGSPKEIISTEIISSESKPEKTENPNSVVDEPLLIINPDSFEQQSLLEEHILSQGNRGKFRIIGQAFDTYWMVQFEDQLLMIDQHAAHEKVNYERLMKNFREQKIATQMLLPSVVVTLNSKEQIALMEHMDAFERLGFQIEEFGGNEYSLRGVPTDLYGHNERELFLQILEDLTDTGSKSGAQTFHSIEEKIASMACKASIKGGMHISLEEAEKLIDEMLTLENPYNCPHGRPTTIVMSKYEMERKFKRVVN